MQTRAAKQRQAELERRRVERHERIGRQAPPPTLHRAVMGGETRAVVVKAVPKLTRRQKVRHDIRDSARGEECLVRIPGVCQGGTEHTIWSHYRGMAGDKGMGTKALDLCGALACTACDAVYDGQAPRPPGMGQREVEWLWFIGHMRSLVRLAEKGLL